MQKADLSFGCRSSRSPRSLAKASTIQLSQFSSFLSLLEKLIANPGVSSRADNTQSVLLERAMFHPPQNLTSLGPNVMYIQLSIYNPRHRKKPIDFKQTNTTTHYTFVRAVLCSDFKDESNQLCGNWYVKRIYLSISGKKTEKQEEEKTALDVSFKEGMS